jgi:outer membrane protein assembly factor BamB
MIYDLGDDGMIYVVGVGSPSNAICSLYSNSTTKWCTTFSGTYDNYVPSLDTAANRLYLPYGNSISAFDTNDGSIIWTHTIYNASFVSSSKYYITGNMVQDYNTKVLYLTYSATDYQFIGSFDPITGSQVSSYLTSTDTIVNLELASPSINNNSILHIISVYQDYYVFDVSNSTFITPLFNIPEPDY